MKPRSDPSETLPIQHFERQEDWADWLAENHGSSPGLWLQLTKKWTDVRSISYDQAIEIALCLGWIDGQKKTHNEQFWLQKFSRRSDKSVWSKINRDRALALIEAGKMKPSGRQAVEQAGPTGAGTPRMTRRASPLCRMIFSPHWTEIRAPGITSKRSTAGIDMPSCSGSRLPERPNHARRKSPGSCKCWHVTRGCTRDRFIDNRLLLNNPSVFGPPKPKERA